MGWDSVHRDKGQTNDEFFRGEFDDNWTIVKSATVRDAWYAAVRYKDSADVTAMVIIFRWSPRSYWNFSYKDMPETWLPEDHAPAEVLNALTPTDNADAIEWRRRCRANLAKMAQLSKGARVKFAEPFAFTDGAVLDALTYQGGNLFEANGTRYRLAGSGWRDREFTVL